MNDIKVIKKLLHDDSCEFVSLGYNCDVAHLLRYSGLRKRAYPFDWCITPVSSIPYLIKENFIGFLDFRFLTFSEPHNAVMFEGEGNQTVETDNIVVTAYCSKYNMIFPHDFNDVSDDTLCKVRGKYIVRIDRFKTLMASNKTVVFIVNFDDLSVCRAGIDELQVVFSEKYPDLKFHILKLEDVKVAIKKDFVFSFLFFVYRKINRFKKSISRFTSQ